MNATAQLTSEELYAWDRDGFLVLRQFIGGETLHELQAAYDKILSGKIRVPGDRMLGGLTRQVMRPSSVVPIFDKNPAVDRAMEVARQALNERNVVRTYDMLIYKPPGHPHDTPWHQDAAYSQSPFATGGSHIRPEYIQFNLPLDDVDLENGCMQFAPGYQSALLQHHVASGDPNDDDRLLALVSPNTQLDLSNVVAAEIPAGGVTMHSYGTPHYTGPNRSAMRGRRSYIFTIAARSAVAHYK